MATSALTVRKTIILVGINGNGKSSIGNAILGENAFSTTVFNENKLDVTTRRNGEFNIFDCSGIGDTGEYMAKDKVSVVNLAKSVVDKVEKNNLTAILFVLKYGTRFTKQGKDAVTMVKSIFGDNVFKEFVIIAFSYGDLFERDAEDGEIFKQWCCEQTGDLKSLLGEVNYRCVLFNKHATSHSDSLKQLRHCIDSMQTVQISRLQVPAYNDKVIAQDVTKNKEHVKANQKSCSKCCIF